MERHQLFIGIDVSKAQLDLAQRPEGHSQVFPQTPAGIENLVAHVQALNPAAIVLEATGGLEVPVASALAVAGLPVAVINPVRSGTLPRRWGGWQRRMSSMPKSGPVCGSRAASAPPMPDAAVQAFSALLSRRRQLIEMRVAEQNRLGTATLRIQQQIRKHLTWLDR